MTTQGFNDTSEDAIIQLITEEDALRNGGWTATLHLDTQLDETVLYRYAILHHGGIRAYVGTFTDERSATHACMAHAVRVASRG